MGNTHCSIIRTTRELGTNAENIRRWKNQIDDETLGNRTKQTTESTLLPLKRLRIELASAMTMTRNNEDTIRDNPASYLDFAEFISNYGANIEANLHQLWRRIIFNIAISNTDDHLRNHGFILTKEGWILSPAYDLNPYIDKDGLALNIDTDNNDLDFELAKSVGEYFRLNKQQMETIIQEVLQVISNWKTIAKEIGISRSEQELMIKAFHF